MGDDEDSLALHRLSIPACWLTSFGAYQSQGRGSSGSYDRGQPAARAMGVSALALAAWDPGRNRRLPSTVFTLSPGSILRMKLSRDPDSGLDAFPHPV